MNTTTQPPTVTEQVAARFHEMLSTGKFHEAMQELYADNARHIEAMEMPGSPYKKVMEGKPTLLKMSEHWGKTTTVHSASVGKPLVNDNQFICEMTMDCTCSEGPMAGQRMQMREYALYTVKDGRITEAKFFYSCG
ncbi:MAG TPA: nuclear transport factor 2 family protein [Phycisphaerales bacterium]|nr:nuclear transport factor 2 family protein [Phycisphaerales bacterium]